MKCKYNRMIITYILINICLFFIGIKVLSNQPVNKVYEQEVTYINVDSLFSEVE